jgi:ABC-2 type transport system permease protein
MNLKRTIATMVRVLRQLSHDHRTLALIILVPSILLIVMNYVFEQNSQVFDGIAPLILGIIPFTLMFIVTSVAVLRERTSGTLERLLISPASRLDILFGYAGAFALLAFLQAALASFITLGVFSVPISGSTVSLLVVAVLAGILGMSLGLLFSAFAKNEFQAVQFMPAFVLPQFLTCGLFIPRDDMASLLRYFSDLMPITYVVEAMKQIQTSATWTGKLSFDVCVISGFILVALVLGALSLKAR